MTILNNRDFMSSFNIYCGILLYTAYLYNTTIGPLNI